MDSNKLKAIIFVVFTMFVALYLGISAATAQEETVIWVLGVATLMTCLLLGRRIWLLIPFLGSVELALRIPGQPSTLLLAQILVLCFSLLLLMMRKLPFRLRITELEWWLAILTMTVLQAYLRNPVGLNIFGGTNVGGKPYAIFGIGILVALLLSGLRVPISELKSIIRLSILGGLTNFCVGIASHFIPSVAFWTGGSYVNTGEVNYENAGVAIDENAATRIDTLTIASRNFALWISSFISPLKACFRPLWLPLVIFTIIGAAFSGYRSSVITVGTVYLIGLAYRGGVISILFAGLGGFASIALLAIINLIHPLPPNVQRGLSFMPGTWEERYTADATGSTDWRVEIWQEALLTDRWIKNKWLGDGLGFSAHELASQLNARDTNGVGISGFDAHRETILSNGDYHSTLVSGVRTAGVVGTLVLMLATFRLAVHAHRLIRIHRRDEYYPLCLFVGIPLVAAPFWLMIGSNNFGQVASTFALGLALTRLLENNLPVPELRPTEAARSAYRAPRNRSSPAATSAS